MTQKDWADLYYRIANSLKLSETERIKISEHTTIETIKDEIRKLYEKYRDRIKNENPKLFEEILMSFEEEKYKPGRFEMTPKRYQRMVEIMEGSPLQQTEEDRNLKTIAIIYLEKIKNLILRKYDEFVKLLIPKLKAKIDLKNAIKHVLRENKALTQDLIPFDPVTTKSEIVDMALLDPLIEELSKDKRISKIIEIANLPDEDIYKVILDQVKNEIEQKGEISDEEIDQIIKSVFGPSSEAPDFETRKEGYKQKIKKYLEEEKKKEQTMKQEVKKALFEIFKIIKTSGFYLTSENKLIKIAQRFRPLEPDEEFDPTELIIDPYTPEIAYEEKEKREREEKIEKEIEKEIEEIEESEILDVIKDIGRLFEEKIGHVGKSEFLRAAYLVKDPRILAIIRHTLAQEPLDVRQTIKALDPLLSGLDDATVFKILVQLSNLAPTTKEQILGYSKEKINSDFTHIINLIKARAFFEALDKINLITEVKVTSELIKQKFSEAEQRMIDLIENKVDKEIKAIEEIEKITNKDRKNIINKFFEKENYVNFAEMIAKDMAMYFTPEIKAEFLQTYYQATPKVEEVLSKGEEILDRIIIDRTIDHLLNKKDEIKKQIERRFNIQ